MNLHELDFVQSIYIDKQKMVVYAFNSPQKINEYFLT